MSNATHPLTVAEVSKKTGVSADAIRYYCRIGLLRPPRDRQSGYKLFSAADIQRLRFIGKAKKLGFKLHEIATIIRESTAGRTPCPLVRTVVVERLVENDRNLAELASLQRRMKAAAAAWAAMPDGIPDGDTVCHLIESLGDDRTWTLKRRPAESAIDAGSSKRIQSPPEDFLS